jgi:hypothetical protein
MHRQSIGEKPKPKADGLEVEPFFVNHLSQIKTSFDFDCSDPANKSQLLLVRGKDRLARRCLLWEIKDDALDSFSIGRARDFYLAGINSLL